MAAGSLQRGPACDASSASGAASGSRSAFARGVDWVALVLFAAAWGLAAAGLAARSEGAERLWLPLLAWPLGHLLADLLSGLLHWFADEFFEEDTPLLGPGLIYGFRDHHRNPRDILAHGLAEVSGYNALAMLPFLSALLLWPSGDATSRVVHAVVLATALSIALTNQLHRLAHAERVHRAVAQLQRLGLILSPEAHARHHAAGDRAYCVTAGWWNPLLDGLGVLGAVSRRVHALAARLLPGR